MKKKLFVLFLIFMFSCLSFMAFAACSDTGNDDINTDYDNSYDDKITAVIEDEPAGYIQPTLDAITSEYVQPSLSDEQMYAAVFTDKSQKITIGNDDLPDLDFSKGEAYFIPYVNGFDKAPEYAYKCSDISTSINLSSEYNKYLLNIQAQRPLMRSYAVKNAYWQQYFDVMLANINFETIASATPVESVLLAELSTADCSYEIYENGAIFKKVNSDTFAADKSVDAPKIYLAGLVFETLNDASSGFCKDFSVSGAEIAIHYRNKIATISSENVTKLFVNKNTVPSFDAERLINQSFLFDNDYAYFRNGDDYYAITAENAAYCVRTSSIYTDKFDSPSDFYVKYSFNYVVKLKNAFDFETIKSLFNE